MDSKYSKIHKNDNLRYGLSCGFKPSLSIYTLDRSNRRLPTNYTLINQYAKKLIYSQYALNESFVKKYLLNSLDLRDF